MCGAHPQLRARASLIYEARMTRKHLLLVLSCFAAACGDTGLNGDPDMTVVPDMSTDDAAKGDMKGAGNMMCDLVKQNCAAGMPKCTISIDQQAQAINHVCVADGSKNEGESCARVGMTPGDDNCAKGLFCTGRGLAMGQFACRKYCQKDGDCVNGQKCAGLQGKDGICTPTCTAFAGGCGTGTTCGNLYFGVGATQADPKAFLGCRPGPGTVASYDDCSAMGAQCGANAICDPQNTVCLPLCDGSHTCPQPANAGVDGGVPPFTCTQFGDVSLCDNSGP